MAWGQIPSSNGLGSDPSSLLSRFIFSETCNNFNFKGRDMLYEKTLQTRTYYINSATTIYYYLLTKIIIDSP